MYGRLMVRGLARHQKRGKRLFVLLALCAAILFFLLTFQAEFGRQYRDLFVGLQTGHIQVLPPDSPIFDKNPWGGRRQDAALFKVPAGFDAWVRSQPEVAEAAPEITRNGIVYNLDGEFESFVSLIAVPADRKAGLFPLAKTLDGTSELTWSHLMREVPVARSRLETEFGQINPDWTHFTVQDLLEQADQLDTLKTLLAQDFPSYFFGELKGSDHNDTLFALWNKAIQDPMLVDAVPASKLEPYDYHLDDAMVAARQNTDLTRIPFLNKRIFQALYPTQIAEVQEPIITGKSITLLVPSVRSQGPQTKPVIIPAKYAGMVEIMPLYTPNSFVDLAAVQTYLGLSPDEATGYVVRLKDPATTNNVKIRIRNWLLAAGAPGVVTDAAYLGKLFMATAVTFDVILFVLVGIFVLILMVFIINLVLMSMIQRRREIGTGLAMGLTTGGTIGLMVGEVAVIVAVSWVLGSVLGFGFVEAAHIWGIPGMIFFPGQRFFPEFHPEVYLTTLAVLFPAALLSAWVPLLGLRKALPIDLFREAR